MMKISLFLLGIFLFSLPAHSHYQWIVDRTEISGQKNTIYFMIGCGHRFPESELLLKKEMITNVQVRYGKTVRSVEIVRKDNFWEGSVECPEGFPVIVEYRLKKRVSVNPFFLGRMVINLMGLKKKDPGIFIGKGLEIIPVDLHLKKRTDYLSFKTYYDGKPVPAKLTIIPEGRKVSYLYPDDDIQCRIKLKYSGRYLVNTFYKGKGSSLTFYIMK